MSIYSSPDIRTEHIDRALDHIRQKRAARLITLHTYKEKMQQKLTSAKATDLAKFERQVDRMEKLLEKADEAIDKAQSGYQKLADLHNQIVNIEAEIDKL